MRNIDIYKKERLIFINKKYSLVRALNVWSFNQVVDILAVVGGLALLVILLAI